MKKALAFALALFMLCGAALATSDITEDNGTATTDVTYQVELCDKFTLTIPPAINLYAPQTGPGIAEGSMQIVLNGNKINIMDFIIEIKLKESEHGFKLSDGTNEIPYVITYYRSGVPMTLSPDEAFFRWHYSGSLVTDLVPEFKIAPEIPADAKPGVYTDVLTFIVEVVDPRETPTA